MIPNIKVEEGEEMDISCTATDGNPLPKVDTITITIITIVIVIVIIPHPGEPDPERRASWRIEPELRNKLCCC